MANKEVVTVLTVKTEQSQNTIKGLKQEIADLKKKLDTAVIGTDEFEQASRELATAQANLKTVLADGKKTTDAVEGSYNHLVATMAELKKQWKATADEVKRNELGQQIDTINSKLKDMDADIGNFQRNVGDYANQFKDAFEQQQKSTENVRLGLDGLQKTAAGLASGYAAVQGAMNLLNIENSNFEKAMIKVQSAMAIAQGIGGMKDLIEGAGTLKVSFQSLRAELGLLSKSLATAFPIAALLAVVAAAFTLIGNMDKLKQKFTNTTPEQKAKKALAEYNVELSKTISQSAPDKVVRLQQLANAYRNLGDNLGSKQKFVKEFAEELGNMDIAMTNVNDADKIFIENTDSYVTALMNRAKAQAIQSKAIEKYGEYLEKRAVAEQELVVAEQNKANGTPDKTFWENVGEAIIASSVYEGASVTDVQNLNKQWTDEIAQRAVDAANNKIAELDKGIEEYMQQAFSDIANYNSLADGVLTGGKKTNNNSGNTTNDLANKQKEIEEEIRRSRLTEEEKLFDDLDKKYDEYIAAFSGNTQKQLEIFNWYSDEYMKLVLKQIDEELEAYEEADKKEYADKVAASEKRLDKKFGGIDSSAKNATFLNERKKPSGNGEIDAIDNELSKLTTLKAITEETMNLKIAAIDAEMALFKTSSDRWIELEEQKKQIREETNRTLLALDDQYVEQSKAKNRALASTISNTFTSSLQSASNIIGALQAGIDTTTKEGFERNKKMQTANAIIQMLVGVTTALSGAFTTKSGPWDWVLAGIQAATIAATGGIQINQIKNTSFEGNSTNAAVATPNINLAESMPIQYTRELLTDSETTNLNKEQRVYVLESDITDTQNDVKVKENNSSF